MNKDIKEHYRKKGWVIVRNFFKKEYITKVKKELLKQSTKKNSFFYYEIINGKKKLRRIERVTDYSKSSKNIICSKNTLNLIK